MPKHYLLKKGKVDFPSTWRSSKGVEPMKLSRTLILISILVGFLILNSPAGAIGQKTISLRTDKVKVIGHSQYLGYLNAYLNLTKRTTPLAGQKIYLDTLLLTDRGGGLYTGGTPYSYDVTGGKTITIKMAPESPTLKPAGKLIKPIVIGTYALKNYIEWVYPQPEAKIRATPITLRANTFRWNYTGTILPTKVTIKNFTTNTEVFTKTVTAEQVVVPMTIFKPKNRYRFDLEVVGPMGQFRLTDAVAPGSKIDFYYWAHMYFDVI